MLDIIAQTFGYIALTIVIIMFQIDDRKKMLNMQIFASTSFFIHFTMIGAAIGAAMNILMIPRNIIFSYRGEKGWAEKKIWPIIFISTFMIAGILLWEDRFSVLPVFGVCIGTVAFWMKDTRKIRFLSLLPHPGWFIYGYLAGSVPSMMTSILLFSSVMVGIIRFDILKKTKMKNKKLMVNPVQRT